MDQQVGTEIPGYRIESVIGGGGAVRGPEPGEEPSDEDQGSGDYLGPTLTYARTPASKRKKDGINEALRALVKGG